MSARFDVLTLVLLKIHVFLLLNLYRMLPIFRRLVVPLPLVLGLLNPADEGITILRNMGSCRLILCNITDELNCGVSLRSVVFGGGYLLESKRDHAHGGAR